MSDKGFERIESLLSNILKSVNDSLPKRVVRYRDVVHLGLDGVETVGGYFHSFDRHELEMLGKQLPPHILDKLHLPFVFVKSIEMEESVYLIRVYGTEDEAFRILMGLEVIPRSDRGPYTYKPYVAEFLNRCPSLAVIGFL